MCVSPSTYPPIHLPIYPNTAKMKFTQALATALLACVATAAPNSGTCANRDYMCRRDAATKGITTASCDIGLKGCVDICQARRRRCAAATDADLSVCEAKLTACTGSVNLGDSDFGLSSPSDDENAQGQGKKTGGAAGGGSAAVMWPRADGTLSADNCKIADDACRAEPGADTDQCGADMAQCMGHCSKRGDACRAVPGADMADCSAAYAECLGENPYVE